jgi:hypothetical protein
MTLFPDARVRFWNASNPTAFWRAWTKRISHSLLMPPFTICVPAGVSLVIDIGMLERMNAARINAHVERAFQLDCRYILSVCSGDGADAVSAVQAAVDRWYWLHPMASRAYLDRHLLVRNGAFLLGWKRLRA